MSKISVSLPFASSGPSVDGDGPSSADDEIIGELDPGSA